VARGGCGEDVQAVADLQVFHVAEIGVEPGEGFVFGGGGFGAGFGEQAG